MAVAPVAQAARTAAGGIPILFLDTCALLEIIRFAQRPRPRLQADIEAASGARAAQSATLPRLLVVTAELVRDEWLRNQDVLTEVEAHVRDVQDHADRVVASGTYLGRSIAAPLALPALRIPAALHTLAGDLLADAVEIASSPAIDGAAFRRQLAGRGPARRGKDCLGDCVIAETLLEFAAAVRPAGRRPLVFLTYNTNDFTSGGAMPHSDFAADFNRLGIQLVTKWNWAAHSLGI
ncbi:MAG: hypothetical protein ABTD50_22060 [Polyangiaceae bacterium]